jgi:hypothetical protein
METKLTIIVLSRVALITPFEDASSISLRHSRCKTQEAL